jgi:hypothetical protein
MRKVKGSDLGVLYRLKGMNGQAREYDVLIANITAFLSSGTNKRSGEL